MKSSYLNYYKDVLAKVSFDRSLFTKELKKAQQYLNPSEKKRLYHWLEMEGLITKIPLQNPMKISW